MAGPTAATEESCRFRIVVPGVSTSTASPLRVLFVTVDPQRDTPQALAQYVHAFDPQFEGLTGEPAAIGALAKHFGVAVNRVELPGGDYSMDHSAVVFLLNADAQRVAIFTPPFEVKSFVADLHTAAPYLQSGRH